MTTNELQTNKPLVFPIHFSLLLPVAPSNTQLPRWCVTQPGTRAVGSGPSVVRRHRHPHLFNLARAARITKRKAFTAKAETSSAMRVNSVRNLKGKHNLAVKMNFYFNLKAFCTEALGRTA